MYRKQIYNMGKRLSIELESQEFLSVAECSKMFDLTRRTISKLLASGELRNVRFGKEKRIPVTSALYYLTRQGLFFPSEFGDEIRSEIYLAEKGMFDARRSLSKAFDEVIKNKALDI